MGQRPVRETAVPGFEDGSETEAEGSARGKPGAGHDCRQLQAVAEDLAGGRGERYGWPVGRSLAVASEGVGCPAAVWGKVELPVGYAVNAFGKQLEAGMLPEVVRGSGWPGCRDDQMA